jgi:hypothetical protein
MISRPAPDSGDTDIVRVEALYATMGRQLMEQANATLPARKSFYKYRLN